MRGKGRPFTSSEGFVKVFYIFWGRNIPGEGFVKFYFSTAGLWARYLKMHIVALRERERERLSKYKTLLLCSLDSLAYSGITGAAEANRLIKGFRPHHEGLELCMSIVAKVVSKG